MAIAADCELVETRDAAVAAEMKGPLLPSKRNGVGGEVAVMSFYARSPRSSHSRRNSTIGRCYLHPCVPV